MGLLSTSLAIIHVPTARVYSRWLVDYLDTSNQLDATPSSWTRSLSTFLHWGLIFSLARVRTRSLFCFIISLSPCFSLDLGDEVRVSKTHSLYIGPALHLYLCLSSWLCITLYLQIGLPTKRHSKHKTRSYYVYMSCENMSSLRWEA